MTDNHSLESLSLGRNDFSTRGLTDLMTAFITNKTLKKLNLERNGLTDYDAKMICTTLKHNSSLSDLFLGANRFSVDGRAELQILINSGFQGKIYGVALDCSSRFRSKFGLDHLHQEGYVKQIKTGGDKATEPFTVPRK